MGLFGDDENSPWNKLTKAVTNPIGTVRDAAPNLFGGQNSFANQFSDKLSNADLGSNIINRKNDPFGTAAKNAYGVFPISGLTSPNDSAWDFGLKPTPPPGAPPIDPNIASVKQGQNDLYNQFSTNKPQIEKNLLRQYQLQAHQDLAGQQAQIRRQAASEGLMNSGIRLGREAGAAAQSAGNVASAKQNINTATDQMQQELQAEAADAGFMQQRIASDINDNIYNQALKNMASRNAGISGLAQAGGSAAGAYAANAGRKGA